MATSPQASSIGEGRSTPLHRAKPKYIKEDLTELGKRVGLSYINISHINTINNQLFKGRKPLDNLDWVDANERAIVKWIKDRDWKPNTRRTYLNALCVYYRDIMKNADKMKKYKDMVLKLEEEENKVVGTNELRIDELYLPLNEIEGIRDRLLAEWRLYPDNPKVNELFLFFALMTMQPPLRSEYCHMRILKYDKNITDKDYMYKKGRNWYVRINVVIKHQKLNHFSNKLSLNLSKYIDESLNAYPRDWLLASWDTNNAMASHNKLPFGSLSTELRAYRLGVSAFRKAYITQWYEDHPKASTNERKALGKLMRHNYVTGMEYYDKRGITKSAIKEKEDRDMKKMQASIAEVKPAPPPRPAQQIERHKPGPAPKYENYALEYHRAHRDQINAACRKDYEKNKIRRRAVRYTRKLNLPEGAQFRIPKPNPNLVNQYKLKEKNGKWTTEL